jgi:hypothetical protein
MAGPTTFLDPSAGGTSQVTLVYTAFVNNIWVVGQYGDASNPVLVRYCNSSDPSGTWTTAAALPSPPSGYGGSLYGDKDFLNKPVYVGGTYYFLFRYGLDSAPGPFSSSNSYRYRIYSTTNFSSWTEITPGSEIQTGTYWNTFDYIDGKFILTGFSLFEVSGSEPWPWRIAHSTTADGTYTLVTGSTSGLSGITQDRPQNLIYDGSNYYMLISRGPGNPAGGSNPYVTMVATATSLGGTWTLNQTGTQIKFLQGYATLENGKLITVGSDASDVNNIVSIDVDDFSVSTYTKPTGDYPSIYKTVAGWWVVLEGANIFFKSNLASGSWTQSTESLTYSPFGLSSSGSYVVVGSNGGEVNYAAYTAPPDPTYQIDLTTTEQSLGTYTGYVICDLDLSDMSAGDAVELTAYSATSSGGTKRLLTKKTYIDAQGSAPTAQLVPVYAPYGVEFKIKKTNATGDILVNYKITVIGD